MRQLLLCKSSTRKHLWPIFCPFTVRLAVVMIDLLCTYLYESVLFLNFGMLCFSEVEAAQPDKSAEFNKVEEVRRLRWA